MTSRADAASRERGARFWRDSQPSRRSLSFAEAASSIGALVERAAFVTGYCDSGGAAPFTREFGDGLVALFPLELDEGYRLLGASEVAGWGVHPDRLTMAAVSMVYHRARGREFAAVARDSLLLRHYRGGDGLGTGAALALEQLLWEEWLRGLLFALPVCDELLVCSDIRAAAAFRDFVERSHAEGDEPLSASVFRVVPGGRAFAPLLAGDA